MQTEFLTIKGTEVSANTERLVTTTTDDRTITVFVDISVDEPEIENAAALLAGTLLKNLTSVKNSSDILNAIRSAVESLAQALPNMIQSVSEILPISIAAILEEKEHIKIAATGKLTIYRVSGGKMSPIYMMLDREPVELTPNGEILNFDISIESVEKENTFSIIIVSDGMVEYVKNPKIVSLLSKVASPKAIIRKLRQYLEQNPPRSNATIAIMWEPKVLEEEGITGDITGATLTLTSSKAQKEEVVEKLKKTYTRETLKKLTQTLRDIREEVVVSGKKAQEKTQTKVKPKLIAQKKRKATTEISVYTAIIIIIVLLCLAICGYYGYGIWKSRQIHPQTAQQTHTTQQASSSQPSSSTTATKPEHTSSTEQTITTPTTSTTSKTSTANQQAQQQPAEETSETTSTTTNPTENANVLPVELEVITKPSGLRTSLVVNGKVVASAKAPATLSAQIPVENHEDIYVVAMFQGSICASVKVQEPTQTIKLDCTYLTEDNPEKPIVILTRPSNIRIKVFRKSDNKLLLSALAPTRIPVLGPGDEEIVIRAYIKGKQCSAVVTTWREAIKKKYLTLVCTK